MSHHQSAGPATIQVIVVTSSRTDKTDRSGKRISELATEAGHVLLDTLFVADDRTAIREAVEGSGAQVVILTGGTGLAGSDVTPEALHGVITRRIPGFGELFRSLSFHEVGAKALWSRAFAGLVGSKVVFALPGSTAACELATSKLILPDLGHLLHIVDSDGPQPTESAPDPEPEPMPEEDSGEPKLPPPSGTLGRLGSSGIAVGMQAEPDAKPPAEDTTVPDRGWKRALYELKAEVHFDKRHPLPDTIETFAPVNNTLDGCGEVAVLEMPSGAQYALYGWPDLRRPSSKVLAISFGDPLAEVIALHRYPVQTGTCVDEGRALLKHFNADVGEVCEAIVGRRPRDTSGNVFAVQGDCVWILRGRKVFAFDGRREVDDGTPKQVLATLVLRWSNR